MPRPIEEIFTYFSDARNLAEITPPWMGFHILTQGKIEMRVGAKIQYRIGVHGIPMRWTTEIREWTPPHRFIDVQLSGPYALWHHTHRFDSRDGGTRIRDTVHYRLPFGPLGRIVNRLFVARDVGRIFDYRAQRIRERFGAAPEPAP
ncbi:MAG TPA: SRPBCC family protein [Rhizomicrobium sp.]|jgi:hypothetical protein|nr:SRPBCC family protein [Rhizomicrobium sp.]